VPHSRNPCCVSPLKSSTVSSTLVSTQSSTHCPSGAGGLSTREVDRRTSHPADSGHLLRLHGQFFVVSIPYMDNERSGSERELLSQRPEGANA